MGRSLLLARSSSRVSGNRLTRAPQLGMRLVCNLRDTVGREICLGLYEPQEVRIFHRLLSAGDCVVDCGANIGFFSLLAARLTGEKGNILAIEADPRIALMLRVNVAINDLERVQVLEVAAAAHEGSNKLEGYSDTSTNFGVSRISATGSEQRTVLPTVQAGVFEVSARRLDSILTEAGVTKVDLLKMDIEGAEAFAIEGMGEWVVPAKCRHILLELHPAEIESHGRTAAEIIDKLLQAGFHGLVIDHSREVTRRLQYNPKLPMSAFVRRFQPGELLGRWPHLLFASEADISNLLQEDSSEPKVTIRMQHD